MIARRMLRAIVLQLDGLEDALHLAARQVRRLRVAADRAYGSRVWEHKTGWYR